MSIVEGFERKALFNITRAVALVCVTVFLLGILGGALYGVSVWQESVNTKITPQEIIDPLKPVKAPPAEPSQPKGAKPPVNAGPADSPLAGFKVPFSLQKYVSGENAQIIRNHLNDVPEVDRQQYLDELGAVVAAAEASKVDPIEAINAYMHAKGERYTAAAVKTAEKWATLKLVAEVAAGGLLLVALFSLVLALLAIERNTRHMRGREVQAVSPVSEQAVEA
jgi:hypothetical protein